MSVFLNMPYYMFIWYYVLLVVVTIKYYGPSQIDADPMRRMARVGVVILAYRIRLRGTISNTELV